MKLTEHVYMVASGYNGFTLTHPLDCNIYVIRTGDGLIMLDAGVGLDNALIEAQFERDGLSLSDVKMIVLTHAHADHTAGAPYFLDKTGAQLVADRHEASILADQKLLSEKMQENVRAGWYPEGCPFPAVHTDRVVKDGDRIELGGVSLECVVCPGHTGGGLCLLGHLDGKKALFTGDVVFFNGKINLLSIFDADLLAYKSSIKRLAGYGVDTLFPGHLQPVMNGAAAHIEKADKRFDDFLIPDTLV